MTVRLGTKAETLARLESEVTLSHIKPQLSFTVEEWGQGPDAKVASIAKCFPDRTVVVRSSGASEDTASESKAGAYASLLNVNSADPESVTRAVETVIASYAEGAPGDQVLVQEQLRDIQLCGVLFTRDLTTLAPYYVFNYDDLTGSTHTVTSGTGRSLKTYVRFRRTEAPVRDPALARVIAVAQEIEGLVESDRLEMELAVDRDGRAWVFQVRAITTPVSELASDEAIEDFLQKVSRKVEKLGRAHPHLYGTRSVFGVMPDWNPAEIVGLKPRALALSLYKEIITDSIWAYQRDNYGYRNLRSFPLLISLLGVPFIDVRVSFNSFIPKGVTERLAEKLANYYVDCLVEQPHAHDKVEFEIVLSCYYPGVRERIKTLEDHGFTSTEVGEILSALRVLTNRIIRPDTGLYRADLAKIETLIERRRQVLDSEMSRVDQIYWLIEDCKRYGTLPFSGLARAGFIAVEYLKGFVATGIFSEEDYHAVLASMETGASLMKRSLQALVRGEIDREDFLREYGHLRPGTYNILSPRYDENFERHFGDLKEEPDGEPPPFELSGSQARQIDELLSSDGILATAQDVMSFIKVAIEGREYGKLVFTRSLSDALVILEALGEQCGLSRDDVSHLNIHTVQQLYASLDAWDLRDVLLRDIEANRRAFEVTRLVQFPQLIVEPEDVYHFDVAPGLPNYVTQKRISAEVIRDVELEGASPVGKIVCIPSADPGYDWLFSKSIAGLVTQFGGANSHMAIRAAEQELPAVIGCGELNYKIWSQAGLLELDCTNRNVTVIR